jgi:hypothetical protein
MLVLKVMRVKVKIAKVATGRQENFLVGIKDVSLNFVLIPGLFLAKAYNSTA